MWRKIPFLLLLIFTFASVGSSFRYGQTSAQIEKSVIKVYLSKLSPSSDVTTMLHAIDRNTNIRIYQKHKKIKVSIIKKELKKELKNCVFESKDYKGTINTITIYINGSNNVLNISPETIMNISADESEFKNLQGNKNNDAQWNGSIIVLGRQILSLNETFFPITTTAGETNFVDYVQFGSENISFHGQINDTKKLPKVSSSVSASIYTTQTPSKSSSKINIIIFASVLTVALILLLLFGYIIIKRELTSQIQKVVISAPKNHNELHSSNVYSQLPSLQKTVLDPDPDLYVKVNDDGGDYELIS